MNSRIFVLVILTAYMLSSCNEEDFLEGYDKQALFATPSSDEINAVKLDWESRDLSSKEYKVEQTIEVTTSGTILKFVSFKVGEYREYGALLIPKSDIDLPVRMFINGFGKDITSNSIRMVIDNNTSNPFILAIPSLRGQSLIIILNDTEYTSPISEGIHCDAFDGATDDAIAFLNVIEATESHADTDRVSVRGGSRGGTVALLMGERDKRVKFVVGVAGPTNLLELASQNENDLTYQCQFLEDLVKDVVTLSEARLELIASSPIFFAKDLPKTQIHLAKNDNIVPVSQGDELMNKMNDLGLSGILDMYVYEGRDHSNIANENKEMSERIELFLSQL